MTKYRIPSDYKNDVSKAAHSWSSGAGSPIHLGLAYPTHHRHLNVGDRIRGEVSTLVQSNPMQGPLLNGFRLVTIATFMPDGVIYGWLRNGKRYTPDQYKNFVKYYFNPLAYLQYNNNAKEDKSQRGQYSSKTHQTQAAVGPCRQNQDRRHQQERLTNPKGHRGRHGRKRAFPYQHSLNHQPKHRNKSHPVRRAPTGNASFSKSCEYP